MSAEVNDIASANQQRSVVKPKGFTKALRDRMSLAKTVSAVVFGSIVLSTLAISYFAMQTVYENKVIDHWSISFLDLEHRNHRLFRALELALKKRKLELPSTILVIDSDGNAFDYFSRENVVLKTLGFESLAHLTEIDQASVKVIHHNDKYYFVDLRKGAVDAAHRGLRLPPGRYLFAWEFEFDKIIQSLVDERFSGNYYLANSSSQLVFSNQAGINSQNFAKRPLVASFINSPLSQGQIQINDAGKSRLGVFQEVSGTNLVSFVETTRNDVLSSVWQSVLSFGGYVVVILFVTILIVQVPILAAVRPLRELIQMAREISSGNFTLRATTRSFGEVDRLAFAMNQMSSNLIDRDQQLLRKTQQTVDQQKTVYSQEIANAVQHQLLCLEKVPTNLPFSVAHLYQQGLLTSGDWIGQHYDDRRQELIFAIADVTGNQLRAGLTATIVSTLFQDQVRQNNGFDLKNFFERLNSCLFLSGKGAATCRALVGRFNSSTSELQYISAGIESPIYSDPGQKMSGEKKLAPTDLLGLNSQLHWQGTCCATVKLRSGNLALFYTDGLRLRNHGKKAAISRRRLERFITANRTISPGRISEHLQSGWLKSCANYDARKIDDVCALLLKVS